MPQGLWACFPEVHDTEDLKMPILMRLPLLLCKHILFHMVSDLELECVSRMLFLAPRDLHHGD